MLPPKNADDDEEGGRERFFVLLRHGSAEDATEGKSDEDRELTSDGHAEMKQIAKGLETAFPKALAIYSSPLVRAKQTALWISKGYRSRVKVNVVEALRPGAPTADLRDFLGQVQERRTIIVGHEPSLSSMAMTLVGVPPARIFELKPGGCYGVRVHGDGKAIVEWLLSPRILRKLAEED